MPYVPTPEEELADAAVFEQEAKAEYGRQPTAADVINMRQQIREERGMHLYRRSLKISVWLVWWPSLGRLVAVCYHTKRKSLISVVAHNRLRLQIRQGFREVDVRNSPDPSEPIGEAAT